MPLSYIAGSLRDFHEDEIAALDIYDEIPDKDIPRHLSGIIRYLRLLEEFDDHSCFVGRDEDGEVCAVANIDELQNDGTLWIKGIAVHPEYRGQGIGHEFIEYLSELARQQGKQRLGSRAVLSSVDFHRQEGFTQEDNHPSLPLMHKYI